ncbi:cysteine desulfurase family protein [Sphingomonas sp.]|uniref:cysteine desulfurase family protein n=1 Tax=Sphingomonas sp. TaxID=28214 RepID=UPI00286E83D4|nr:cysteine desulfurase family protein [Sphingomonas sp.]
MIYLDYQATTPLAPEVAEAMEPWAQEKFANPHAPSRWGREAAAAIEVAREQVQDAIYPNSVRVERSRDTSSPAERSLDDARDERINGSLAFTGSATEALNWALKGTLEQAPRGRTRIVTIATEHAAVLDSCDWLEGRGVEVTRLGVGDDGLIDPEALAAALDERVALVAAMLVNNEIGVIQPIAAIADAARKVGALMLCDAVQGLGRVPIPAGPDLIAVSAHKLHGPKGIGALWMREGAEPATLIHGGGQERGLRSGTLSPALCVGFGAATKLAQERREQDQDFLDCLWRTALAALGPSWTINGSEVRRCRGNLNIRRPGLDAARLISDLREIAFSLGSACASGSGRPSHVLRALGLTPQQTRASIRLGFGRYTTTRELESACRRITEAADAQRGLAA